MLGLQVLTRPSQVYQGVVAKLWEMGDLGRHFTGKYDRIVCEFLLFSTLFHRLAFGYRIDFNLKP